MTAVAVASQELFGQAVFGFGTFETCQLRRAMSEFEVQSGKHVLVLNSSQFDPMQTSTFERKEARLSACLAEAGCVRRLAAIEIYLKDSSNFSQLAILSAHLGR
jgi:hypothetical protein